jgi:hypothetical protein
MNLVIRVLARPVLLAGLLSGGWALAQEPTTQPSDNSTAVQPDNTKINQRDRNANEPTADQ